MNTTQLKRRINRNCIIYKRTSEILEYAYNSTKLKQIFDLIGLTTNDYAIGGSVAAILYGININRTPYDIDVIVNPAYFNAIKISVKQSFAFVLDPSTESIDDEFGTEHFSFRAIKGPSIDIIAYQGEWNSELYINQNHISVMTLNELYKAKQLYHRTKDEEDLIKLKQLVEELQ